jgi:hypothetical protein
MFSFVPHVLVWQTTDGREPGAELHARWCGGLSVIDPWLLDLKYRFKINLVILVHHSINCFLNGYSTELAAPRFWRFVLQN